MVFVLGSRKSDLAVWQAREVRRLLDGRRARRRLAAGFADGVAIVTEGARGDVVLDTPLRVLAAADPGIFTKELEAGLLEGRYALCVHSLKDMPTTLPRGLVLAGVTRRDDPRDALVLAPRHAAAGARSLGDLPAGSVVGTSSVRREACLRRDYPALLVRSVRGNLNTRMRKLDGVAAPAETAEAAAGASAGPGAASGAGSGAGAADAPASSEPPQRYDALILAAAGMKRMGWAARISARLSPLDMPHCVGQGALGLECRQGDAAARALARCASHGPSALRCLAERAFLNRLQGGCQVPIGVHSFFDGGLGEYDEDKTPALTPAPAAAAPDEDGAPAAPERVRSLSLHGTVTAPDGSRSVSGSVTEVVSVPDADDGAGPEADADGVLPSASEADVASAQQPAVITAAQWARLEADGTRIGRRLADQLLRAGAGALLSWGAGAGDAPGRPITYGSAETPLDRD